MGIRVPSANSLQGSVREAATPNLRVNTTAPAEAFGGGAASQSRITGAMSEAFNIVKQESEKADSLAVLEAETQIARRKNEMVFDPKTGLITRKGKSAMEAVQEFSKSFDEEAGKVESSLQTERQKMLYRQKVAAQRDDFNSQLQKHAAVEIQKFDQEQSESRLALAKQDAALRFTEPDAIAASIEVQKGVIIEQAVRLGMSEEWVKLKTEDAQSKTHLTVLDRMLNAGNDLEAEGYLKANKNQFTGTDLADAEKLLQEGMLLGKTQRESDRIMGMGLSMSQALDQARLEKDPKVRDRLTAEVRERYQLDKIAKEDARNNIFDRAANIIERNGGDTTQIPRAQWAALSLQDRNAIDARARQLKMGIEPSTDWQKYYEVKTLASNDSTRNEFLRTNLMELRPKMAEAEFKELVNLQTQMRKGESADKLLSGFRTNLQVVQGTLRSIGLPPKPKPGSDDAVKVETFMRAVDEQVIAFQNETGKKATSEDVQRIADNLVVKGEIPDSGWFWNDSKRVYELGEDDKIVVAYEDVPRNERLKIQEALRNQGIQPNEDNITAMYNARIQRQRQGRGG